MKITITLVREVMDGWGWEMVATDKNDKVLAHTDVGYFDLDDYLSQRFGNAEFTVINNTELK